MLIRFANHFDDMALAIVLWMCTLPLVGLLIFPFFGLKFSLLVASALLIFILVMCWSACFLKTYKS